MFYWDGKNLKAFDKSNGNTVGTPLTIATNSNLMSGGIIADECNNIYVGSTNGTIKVYKFNGSIFNDAPAADISIPGYSTKSVYDLAYNESQKLLYASGDGFVAAFDVSSYGCPTTTYSLNINANCGAGTATVTVSPTPPSGSTVTYVPYDGTTQLSTNSTGIFTGLTPGITYTVKVYINQICSGSLTVKDFILPGPQLNLSKQMPHVATPAELLRLQEMAGPILTHIAKMVFFWGQRQFYQPYSRSLHHNSKGCRWM